MKNKMISNEQEVYEAAFRKRLVSMRNSTGMGQEAFAKALRVKRDAYSKYEFRSMLPMYLLPRLIEITGFDAWFVLTGQPATKAPGAGWSKERIADLLRSPSDVLGQRAKEKRHLDTRARRGT